MRSRGRTFFCNLNKTFVHVYGGHVIFLFKNNTNIRNGVNKNNTNIRNGVNKNNTNIRNGVNASYYKTFELIWKFVHVLFTLETCPQL